MKDIPGPFGIEFTLNLIRPRYGVDKDKKGEKGIEITGISRICNKPIQDVAR